MHRALQSARAALLNSSEPVQLWAVAAGLAIPGLWLLLHFQLSLLFFLMVAAVFGLAWIFNRTAALLSVFLYLLLLGDIRRIAVLITGPVRLDPLLIAGPLFAIFVGLPLLLKLRVADPVSKLMLAVTVMMALEVVNPRQGPIVVGVSGGLFLLIPILWFWIARRYATERIVFLLIYRVLIPLGFLAALLGIYQTYVGFLPWEAAWIKHAIAEGYTALNLSNGKTRSFGFSVNSAEFGTLLSVSSACVVAAIMAGRRAYALLLPALLTALVLASQRGVILKFVFACVILWAVRGRSVRAWIPRLALGALVGAALLGYSARHASESASAAPEKTTAGAATSHVTQGLAHPLDARYSTAGAHGAMFLGGIASGFKNPLGSGLGIVTLGAGKFGGNTSVAGPSEVDISDVFIATGFVGGICYLLAIAFALMEVAKYLRTGPKMVGYGVAAILSCMLGAWIPMGQYGLGPVLWFCVGFLVRERARRNRSHAEEAAMIQGEAELLLATPA